MLAFEMYPYSAERMFENMSVRIEVIPNYRVAYVRQVGPYGPSNMQAMKQLKEWAEGQNLLTDSSILLGIAQDNPETTPPDNCRYDACIVIPHDYLLDRSMNEAELSGGTYAVFTIKHTAEHIQQAWIDIFPAIQSSGYQMDNRPIIERYMGNMVVNEYCDLCVPVKL